MIKDSNDANDMVFYDWISFSIVTYAVYEPFVERYCSRRVLFDAVMLMLLEHLLDNKEFSHIHSKMNAFQWRSRLCHHCSLNVLLLNYMCTLLMLWITRQPPLFFIHKFMVANYTSHSGRVPTFSLCLFSCLFLLLRHTKDFVFDYYWGHWPCSERTEWTRTKKAGFSPKM